MSIKEQFWYQKRNNVMMKKGENMTKNKIRKQDIAVLANKINIKSNKVDNESLNNLKLLCNGLKSETEVSLYDNVADSIFSLRAISCSKNAIGCLLKNNIEDAWFEIQDTLDYKKDTDYLSCDEVALLYVLVHTLLCKIEKA